MLKDFQVIVYKLKSFISIRWHKILLRYELERQKRVHSKTFNIVKPYKCRTIIYVEKHTDFLKEPSVVSINWHEIFFLALTIVTVGKS